MMQKYLSDNLQNKNFKISIFFIYLQDNPALLMPWMVYTIIFLVVNTVLLIYSAVEYFKMNDATNGVVHIGLAIIYFCK
jgi:hypothetical protein